MSKGMPRHGSVESGFELEAGMRRKKVKEEFTVTEPRAVGGQDDIKIGAGHDLRGTTDGFKQSRVGIEHVGAQGWGDRDKDRFLVSAGKRREEGSRCGQSKRRVAKSSTPQRKGRDVVGAAGSVIRAQWWGDPIRGQRSQTGLCGKGVSLKNEVSDNRRGSDFNKIVELLDEAFPK